MLGDGRPWLSRPRITLDPETRGRPHCLSMLAPGLRPRLSALTCEEGRRCLFLDFQVVPKGVGDHQESCIKTYLVCLYASSFQTITSIITQHPPPSDHSSTSRPCCIALPPQSNITALSILINNNFTSFPKPPLPRHHVPYCGLYHVHLRGLQERNQQERQASHLRQGEKQQVRIMRLHRQTEGHDSPRLQGQEVRLGGRNGWRERWRTTGTRRRRRRVIEGVQDGKDSGNLAALDWKYRLVL